MLKLKENPYPFCSEFSVEKYFSKSGNDFRSFFRKETGLRSFM